MAANIYSVFNTALTDKYGLAGKWLANWPVYDSRPLGEIGDITECGFAHGSSLADHDMEFTVDRTESRFADAWTFSSSDGVDVAVGFDAKVPGWEFLGDAQAGIKASFKHAESAYLDSTGSHIQRVSDIHGLKQALCEQAKNGWLKQGQAVVVERLVADKALLMISKSADSSLEATAAGEVAAPTTPAALAGSLTVKRNEQSVDVEGRQQATLAVRVVQAGSRGWFWWRHEVIEGIVPLADPEAGLQDADYFVRF